MNKKPTLLVPIFHSLVSKNVLNTDALGTLMRSGTCRIVLIVPALKQDFFKKHYETDSVEIVGMDIRPSDFGWWSQLMHKTSMLLVDTHYLHYRRKEILEADRSVLRNFKHLVREAIVKIAADKKWAISLFRYLDHTFSKRTIFSTIFERYQPDVVFSTDLFEQVSGQLLREAMSRGIRTVAMVRSWDNCLSKGILRHTANEYLTNNEVLKEELISIHGVSSDKITVTGLPQFDSFTNQQPADRESFFLKHGLDPDKKLVLFAPAGKVLSDTDADICKMFLSAQDEGRLPADLQFFVRNHPQHPADFSSLISHPNLTIQNPGQKLDPKTDKETEMTPDDLDFLRNILAHTDVLVWVATTLCLDAIVYDVPQVVLNFDGYQQKDYYHSVKKYHDEAHMTKMFALHPFKVANSESELIGFIKDYLDDPGIDAQAREKVRQQQLYKIDGLSGKRVSDRLIAALELATS